MPDLNRENNLIDLKIFKERFITKENLYFFVIITSIFFLDRLSKKKIIDNNETSSIFINDYINFDLIWNTGVGFGFFSTGEPIIYNFITILILIVILYLLYIFFSSKKTDKLIYSVIIGGALGNFYDRLTLQAVPDFIDLHYKNLHWFTFNVADIFITLGIISFILRSFFVKN